MSTNRKSLTRIALGLGLAVILAADSADARGRGGSSRGRSGGFSRRSSGRSMSRSVRTNQYRGRTKSSNTRTRNTRVNNTRVNKTRIGSTRRGNTQKNTVRRSSNSNRHNHKTSSNNHGNHKHSQKHAHKHGHNHKHGHHQHHGHHHHKHGHHFHHGHHSHHHWGSWRGHGHHGWGVGFHRHHRHFGFAFIVPQRSYCNPYCEAPGFLPEDGPAVDNSQPLQTQGGQGQQSEKGMQLLMAASEAFTKGDLQTAMTNADAAAAEMKNFPEVHQFRSLVLFAMRKYGESASAAHVALTAGSGWNWATLKGFYPEAAVYTAQVRSLEQYTTANTKDAGGRFLLAYHYLMMGHGPAAVKELRSVVELEPRDTLSAKMLKAVSAKLGKDNGAQPAPQVDNQIEEQPAPADNAPMNATPQPTLQPAPQSAPQSSEQPPAPLNPIGIWKATRDDGLVVELKMTEDGKFAWNAVTKERTIKFDGKFVLAAGEMKLTRSKDSQSLDATVKVLSKDKFQLRIKGRDAKDPGLMFVRQ